MDPIKNLPETIATFFGSKLAIQVLGPTAAYLGEELRDIVKKRIETIKRILETAKVKLGDQIDKNGAVPPRVLKEIINDGSYSNSEIEVEYWGGVLASSRTQFNRDDRAMTDLKTIAMLSTYELRFHYICYYWFRQMYIDSGLRPNHSGDLKVMRLHFGEKFLMSAMDFRRKEPAYDILLHCH